MNRVVPALLVKNKKEFLERTRFPGIVETCPLYQLDILDGSMFNAKSWHNVSEVQAEFLPFLELHVMTENPLRHIEAWAKTGIVKRAIVHAEIEDDIVHILLRLKELGIESGVALSPGTDAEALRSYADALDFVLIMGVEPGASGRPFIGAKSVRSVAKKVRAMNRGLKIGLDGGVDAEVIASLRGVIDQFCVGSKIWSEDDPKAAYRALIKSTKG